MSDYKVTLAHNSMVKFQKQFNGDCQMQSKLINNTSYDSAVQNLHLLYNFPLYMLFIYKKINPVGMVMMDHEFEHRSDQTKDDKNSLNIPMR